MICLVELILDAGWRTFRSSPLPFWSIFNRNVATRFQTNFRTLRLPELSDRQDRVYPQLYPCIWVAQTVVTRDRIYHLHDAAV